MNTALLKCRNLSTLFHFERPRLKNLFQQAIHYPLVLVCAGAGYGKTTAVHDFVQDSQAITVWVQLSDRDNIPGRFRENYTHTMRHVNADFAKEISKIGFPDTDEKVIQFHKSSYANATQIKRRIVVFDDFHRIENPVVLRFIEKAFLDMPPETSLFLISRTVARINTTGLVSSGSVFNISEDDLRFNENELALFFRSLEIPLLPENLHEILQDTKGWAFTINLIARTYQKAPSYSGYLRNAMKSNIFKLMETEIWDGLSSNLQIFFVRLSLIDHLAFDLIKLLAGSEENLILELERQSAYVRMDNYINAYLIHPLFLEFLAAKQDILLEDQKNETYIIAGNWCNKNGFKIDALSYFEKTKDYASIVSCLSEWPSQIPYDIAKFAALIFDRAPENMFEKIDNFALLHFRSYLCQGLWQKTIDIGNYYETKFLTLPESEFRNRNLGHLYYHWSILRGMMSLTDHQYDFDHYMEKFCKYFPQPSDPEVFNLFPAPWINNVGSSKKGLLQMFIDSIDRTTGFIEKSFNGFRNGHLELAYAELYFYQGDLEKAETCINGCLKYALKSKLFDLTHRALFYILRIGIAQGDYQKAQQAINTLITHLDIKEHTHRYANYNICLCWYFCTINQPDNVPEQLKEHFSHYGYAGFLENFENQMKARYHYTTGNYPPLLLYIEEMKKRESFLFGRLEILAIEACIHYKMKNKDKALTVLAEAYETAEPNGIVMPFIELGKDIRTLTLFAIKEYKSGKLKKRIPKTWLESINQKSAAYAKKLGNVILKHNLVNGITDNFNISPKEKEILTLLSHGLSRAEIATKLKLPLNTIKTTIKKACLKLGTESLADAIRIATDRRII
ncbi:MAG: LuxR C-terminal-related transcriptional regulator [Treponema sp.]|nr:LuxR C-terminal-related transcriptional regulator [Treponema sp.]